MPAIFSKEIYLLCISIESNNEGNIITQNGNQSSLSYPSSQKTPQHDDKSMSYNLIT